MKGFLSLRRHVSSSVLCKVFGEGCEVACIVIKIWNELPVEICEAYELSNCLPRGRDREFLYGIVLEVACGNALFIYCVTEVLD